MKTRTNKLYHNVTKKTHKKFSRKKKIYKNKTLKGGNPLIVGLSVLGGVGVVGGSWFLTRYLKNTQTKKRPVNDNIYEEGPPSEDAGGVDTNSRYYEDDPEPVSQPQQICTLDVKEKIRELTTPYSSKPEYIEVLTKIKEIYRKMDENPKINDLLSIHNDLYQNEIFQKQNKAYKLLGAVINENVDRKVPTQYRPAQEIIYKDRNNYYCIYNGSLIEPHTIFKLAVSYWRGGANLGGVLEQRNVEDLSSPVLDEVQRKEAEKRDFGIRFNREVINNIRSPEQSRTLIDEEKIMMYNFFVSLNTLFFESADIREFYNANISSLDIKDYNIIKAFINGKTEEYKEYIATYGTNSKKKIELLNLISSNTICKFLIDYVEQELSETEGITKGTQVYDIISESIRINWRINNIYDEDEKYILYGRETTQSQDEKKYELFTPKFGKSNYNSGYMNEHEYVGGSQQDDDIKELERRRAALDLDSPITGHGRTIPKGVIVHDYSGKIKEQKQDIQPIRDEQTKIDIQTRRKRNTVKGEQNRWVRRKEKAYVHKIEPPSYKINHISGWKYFENMIDDKLYFLNSQNQIPYEVLLILVGFILSTRGDSNEIDNKLVIIAINIIYNEIVRYSRQNIYEQYNNLKTIKKTHRAQAGAWSLVIYCIPKNIVQTKISTQEILVKPLHENIINELNDLTEQLVLSMSDFKQVIGNYLQNVDDICKPIMSDDERIKKQKKILYSIYYFMLMNLDTRWNDGTISNYERNLDLLSDKPFHDNYIEGIGHGSVVKTFNNVGLLGNEEFGHGSGLLSKFIHLRTWQHITGPIP